MNKQVFNADVPTTGGPFNLCIRHGDMIYVSGLPPFDEEYSARLRAARTAGAPIPPFPDTPFDDQARTVMNHLKSLVEAAGSNMECLLKVVVWLKDQSDQEAFDRIYRSYFASAESLPTRTRMQAGRTPMDCALEIDAIGFVPRVAARLSDSTLRYRANDRGPTVDKIQASATFPNIAADKVSEFKQLAAEALDAARGEPGTLQFDWFFSDDGTQCVALETYANSDAVLAHLGNVGPLVGRLVELGGGLKLEVFGDPSAAVRDALAALQPPIYAYFQGK